MKQKTKNGRYSKGGFGINQNLVLVVSLATFILAYYFGWMNDGAVADRFETLKQSNLLLSDEKQAELARLSAEDDADVDFSGQYAYLIDYGSGKMLRGDVSINGESISRSISINHLSMYGSADYDIVGSTVQYSRVSGDKYLFSQYGSAIGVHPQFGKYLELDGDTKLFVETQYNQEEYSPLSRVVELSLVEKLKRMSIWSILQLVFALTGVSILLYVFYQLIRDNRSGPKKAVLRV